MLMFLYGTKRGIGVSALNIIINIEVRGGSENYSRSQQEPVGDTEVGICFQFLI